MGQINKSWHTAHRMPVNATVEQRIEWHLQHAAHCGCREIPTKLKEEMRKRRIKIPAKKT